MSGVICARNATRVSATEAELRAAGFDGRGTSVDITDDAALARWVTSSAERFGGVDILVANAGALANTADLDAWRKGFETDVLGTVATVEHAIPYLTASDAGAIVVMSSAAALEIYAGERPYNAIKATLTAYAGGLAQRLAHTAYAPTRSRPAPSCSTAAFGSEPRSSDPTRTPTWSPGR